MTKQEKYRLLLLMAGVAMLLLFLAAAITRINMQPGDPFPIEWKQAPQGEATPFGNGYWFLVLIRGFLILLVLLVPVYIFINLLTPQGRRRLLKGLIQLLFLLFIMYLVLNWADKASKRNLEKLSEAQPFQLGGGEATPEGLASRKARGYKPAALDGCGYMPRVGLHPRNYHYCTRLGNLPGLAGERRGCHGAPG
jgi:hypothetical protein